MEWPRRIGRSWEGSRGRRRSWEGFPKEEEQAEKVSRRRRRSWEGFQKKKKEKKKKKKTKKKLAGFSRPWVWMTLEVGGIVAVEGWEALGWSLGRHHF